MGCNDFRISSIKKIAKKNLKDNWGVAILISFIVIILSGIGTALQEGITLSYYFTEVTPVILRGDVMTAMEMTSSYAPPLWTDGVVWFNAMLVAPLTVGVCFAFLNLGRGAKIQLKDAFAKYEIFGKCILVSIYEGVLILLWSFLLLIPGIIATYSYALTPYIICDYDDLSITDTVTMSKEMMRGHKMALFALDISFLGCYILPFVVFSLSILLSIYGIAILALGIIMLLNIFYIFYIAPYRNAAKAEFYERVKMEYEAKNGISNNNVIDNDGNVIG